MSESHTADLATRARYRQEGADYEQTRIIKLLEATATAWSEDCTLPLDWKHCQNCWQFASLIALIKGESKSAARRVKVQKDNDHHCGFDFRSNRQTATCKCGRTVTSPYYGSREK